MDLDYHVKRLAVQPSLSVLTTKVCRGWHMNLRSECFNGLHHRRGGNVVEKGHT